MSVLKEDLMYKWVSEWVSEAQAGNQWKRTLPSIKDIQPEEGTSGGYPTREGNQWRISNQRGSSGWYPTMGRPVEDIQPEGGDQWRSVEDIHWNKRRMVEQCIYEWKEAENIKHWMTIKVSNKEEKMDILQRVAVQWRTVEVYQQWRAIHTVLDNQE